VTSSISYKEHDYCFLTRCLLKFSRAGLVVGAAALRTRRGKNTQNEIFTFKKECLMNLNGKYFEKIEFNAGLGRTN
jgi:hypothetical protein